MVSIIAPVYNTEKYLPRCLDSLLAQTYTDFELILVDDGSTDASPAICDEYAAKDGRITVIHKENGGVSSARNRGLEIAKGAYITFADSDDFLGGAHLETLVKLIVAEQADISVVGMAQEQADGVFVPYYTPGHGYIFSQEEMLKNMLENRYYTCSVCDKMFRREVLQGIRWDETVSHNEDLLFLYEVMKNCRRAAYTSDVCYYYCANEGSAVHSKFNYKKMTMIDVWDKLLLENPDKQYVRNQYVRVNIMCAMQAAQDGYNETSDIQRLRKNIRKHLIPFLLSNMALGYKANALLAATNWALFCKRIG